MTLHIEHITFDCDDPRRLAQFWSRALGVDIETDSADFSRLEAGQGGIHFAFQRVPEGKSVKNRVHLDLNSADMAGTVEDLVAFGAAIVATHTSPNTTWTVMQDPEGNEFCVN